VVYVEFGLYWCPNPLHGHAIAQRAPPPQGGIRGYHLVKDYSPYWRTSAQQSCAHARHIWRCAARRLACGTVGGTVLPSPDVQERCSLIWLLPAAI
ncbi:hypothetical protein XENOCAPTIV_010618, partial [Xenoophorus captivus]